MVTTSRFHEHFSIRTNSDLSSDVYEQPSFSTIRNMEKKEKRQQQLPGSNSSNEKRKHPLNRIQEQNKSAIPLKQTSTLNCNGLVFRNTTFVPSANMVQFTMGPPSGPPQNDNKTPVLAKFYFLPHALRLRKAAKDPFEKRQQRKNERTQHVNNNTRAGPYDEEIQQQRRHLATPNLGSSLDIEVPVTLEIPPENFEDAHVVEYDPEWDKVVTDNDDEIWSAAEERHSFSTSSSSNFGTRLSDVVEVTELSDEGGGDIVNTVPMGMEMWVRDWSSCSSEGEEDEENSEQLKRRTWKEV